MVSEQSILRGLAPARLTGTILFLASNVMLAVVMRMNPAIATLHALATLTVGLWFALKSDSARVTYICAYIMGAEVLWRMTRASILWEFGKYSIAIILIVALFRAHRQIHMPVVLYFVLLIPSAIFTVTGLGAAGAVNALSFNLSGPLAISLCIWYFSGVRPREVLPFKVALAALAPILGIAALTLRATLTASALEFGRNSNFITSDGFGPNQVSAALGIGAFLCFFFLVAGRLPLAFTGIMLGCLSACAIQSVMTFSRGGMYMAVGAAAGALFYLLRDASARRMISVGVPVFAILAIAVIVPRLQDFTDGALGRRFSNTGLTRRDTFIAEEAQVWMDHPFFGVGPGMGRSVRNDAAAHTEVTRLMAEHGLWGLGSLLLLIVICGRQIRAARSNLGRAFSLSLVICALLFMLTAALRIVAPAFLLGLSAIPFNDLHFGIKPGGRFFRYRTTVTKNTPELVTHAAA